MEDRFMRSSYGEEDVTILLRDITGLVEPQSTAEREAKIQSGTHYCEMLPIEYQPTEKYMEIYRYALERFAPMTAMAAAVCAEKLYAETGKNTVLVSLARAGTPAGILIKRYIAAKYGVGIPHYTVSIIRGRGLDGNAMAYILRRHRAEDIRFVDGWTGKGAILTELYAALSAECYKGIDKRLAVLSDAAYITELCGTHEDFLIPSSCLNSTVSGLISRTFLRSDIIGREDFHGAVYYEKLKGCDRSYEFIEAVERCFDFSASADDVQTSISGRERSGAAEIKGIQEEFGIDNVNLVKPGIGETTRVLLRRVPNRILVRSFGDTDGIAHILRLAQEKGVEVSEYPLKNYRACGLIKNVAADV